MATSATERCTTEHVAHCFDVLSSQLNRQIVPIYNGEDAQQEYPLFVTWNTIRSSGSTRLRGCIGSFSALPLAKGLPEYALTSAMRDRRFPPIGLSELPRLECCVSLLTDFEDVDDPFDWELGTHGIHIHFQDPTTVPSPAPTDSPASESSTNSSSASASADEGGLKSRLNNLGSFAKRKTALQPGGKTLSATYLPDVAPAQGWTKEETLDSAMRKAGYNGKITDAIRKSIRVTRYQSSKCDMSYEEWQQLRQEQ